MSLSPFYATSLSPFYATSLSPFYATSLSPFPSSSRLRSVPALVLPSAHRLARRLHIHTDCLPTRFPLVWGPAQLSLSASDLVPSTLRPLPPLSSLGLPLLSPCDIYRSHALRPRCLVVRLRHPLSTSPSLAPSPAFAHALRPVAASVPELIILPIYSLLPLIIRSTSHITRKWTAAAPRPRVPAPRAAFVHQHPDFFVSPYLKVATPLENARIIAPVVVVGFYCLSENVVYSSHVYKCFWLV
ncbi:hypothetical protein EDB84DRAFT_1566212 [Lactarius hengduanensis]|nr:hypothetical protein EDB84DRAFT_1566212 [Lactarius hengduanensis]